MPRDVTRPPEPPRLPPDLDERAPAALEAEETYDDLVIGEADLAAQDARAVTLRGVRLDGADLSGSRLDGLRLTDVEVLRGNVSNLRAQGASFERVAFRASRMTGLAVGEGLLRDVTITGCRIDLASFGFCGLERVTFEDCVLRQTDFLDARLSSVRFHGCDLTGADFRGARMTRCELRRCTLEGIEGIDGLRGAAMEWPDIVAMAGVWAAALGIHVIDDDPGASRDD